MRINYYIIYYKNKNKMIIVGILVNYWSDLILVFVVLEKN